MPRSPAQITQAEVKRVVKAVLDAGVEVARVEVDSDCRIIVIASKPGEHNTEANFLNAWMAKRASAAQGH